MSETKNLIAVFLKHLEHTDMGEPPCTPGRECQAKLWLLSGGLERTLFPSMVLLYKNREIGFHSSY